MAAYGFFAALAAPLVLSVHSVVSWDFAMAPTAGLALDHLPAVLRRWRHLLGLRHGHHLLMPMTYAFKWFEYVNTWHFENLAKMCLLTSGILTYAYGMEYFIAWYSQNPYEWAIFYVARHRRLRLGLLDDGVLQLRRAAGLVLEACRTNPVVLFVVSIFINIGMWFERFNIVVSSLAHNFDPATWTYYWPTCHRVGRPHRVVRLVRLLVLAVPADPPGHRHRRDQGDGRSAREGHPGGQVSAAASRTTARNVRIKGGLRPPRLPPHRHRAPQARGLDGFEVQSPLPRHEIEEAMYEGRPAPVRWWTLTGGVTGHHHRLPAHVADPAASGR
jgi:hypothetical protein